jgi:hypothetical protein
MRKFRQQLELFKATHGPVEVPPTNNQPKSGKENRPGKMGQPQRRHIKKEETQATGIPDVIPVTKFLKPFWNVIYAMGPVI